MSHVPISRRAVTHPDVAVNAVCASCGGIVTATNPHGVRLARPRRGTVYGVLPARTLIA